MAVRIRLTRVGATKQPAYRVVVTDGRSARDGRSIETIGHYNPRSKPVEVKIDAEQGDRLDGQGRAALGDRRAPVPSDRHPAEPK